MKKLPHSILRTRKFQNLNQRNRLMWNLWFKWFTNVFIVPKEKCLPIRVQMPSNITWKPIIGMFSSKMKFWKKKNYQRRGLPSSVEIDNSKGCQQLVFERHSVSYFLSGTSCMPIVQLYMLHLPGTAAVAGAETEGTGREAGAAAEGWVTAGRIFLLLLSLPRPAGLHVFLSQGRDRSRSNSRDDRRRRHSSDRSESRD